MELLRSSSSSSGGSGTVRTSSSGQGGGAPVAKWRQQEQARRRPGTAARRPAALQPASSEPPPLLQASRRRALAEGAATACCWLVASVLPAGTAEGAGRPKVDAALQQAFRDALSATTFEDMEAGWARAISLSPDNAAAWSNRGTVRLQSGRWREAYEDLARAAKLERAQAGAASPLLLNNLGNAEGALGRWRDAMGHYEEASGDPEVGPIAAANFALAAWETGDGDLAIRSARRLLRRDPEFSDMRCALTAFLWGSGRRADAEEAWEELQQAPLGAALYSRSGAVERVRHRWPPRATAALAAFLSLSDSATAEGYDLLPHEYRFELPQPGGV